MAHLKHYFCHLSENQHEYVREKCSEGPQDSCILDTVTNDKLRQQAALSQRRSALQAPVQIIWGNGDKVKFQTIDNSAFMIHACKSQLS